MFGLRKQKPCFVTLKIFFRWTSGNLDTWQSTWKRFWMSQNIIMVLFSDPCLNQKLDLRSIRYSGIAWPFLNRQMLVWIGSHSSIWQIYFRGWKRNHESSDSEKSSTKYTYELIAFDPGNAGYRVSESPIFNNPPPLPYIIRAFGADSPLVSPVTLCLMFSFRKTPCGDKTNDDTKSEWSKSLNTKEYKTRLSCPWENN